MNGWDFDIQMFFIAPVVFRVACDKISDFFNAHLTYKNS